MSEKFTKLADYYTQLFGGDKDRVPMKKIDEGVWSHFDVDKNDDAVEYFNLDFTPRNFEYFDMFANWFQVCWQWYKDGWDRLLEVRDDGISGPSLSSWEEPFKLSTFTKENLSLFYCNLPMQILQHGFFHYAQKADKYAAPVDHTYMRTEIPIDQLKINRTALHVVLAHDKDGEKELIKMHNDHGLNMCVNFNSMICSFVIKEGSVYYRPMGRDYYVKIKNNFKKYYKPRAILQVLDSLTGLFYTEKTDSILVRLKKDVFSRWISRGIDGNFLVFVPSRPHIPVDEMQLFVLSYYPLGKAPEEARPIR